VGSVVNLEKDDDFASARGKMAMAGERVALVVPSECRALYRSLAFKMLRRWAQDAAASVVIVTRDPHLKWLAHEYGFPTCSSVRRAEAHWRREDDIARASAVGAWFLRRRAGMLRFAILASLLVAVLGALAFVAVPVATVTLTASTQPVSQRLEITADPSVNAVDVAGSRIPAHVITASVDATDRLPTTGKKEGKAKGLVTFGNLTDAEVRVPQGTVVATAAGHRFETTAATVVPAPRWSSARAEVVALVAGSQGEAARLAIVRVEGPLAQAVAVLNEQPIAVDKTRSDAVVAQQDRDKLRASVYDRLNKQVLGALNQQVKQYETMAQSTIKVESQEEFDHGVGDEAATLSLRMTLRARATVFDSRHIGEVARTALEASAQPGQQLAVDSVRITTPEALAVTGDAVTFATRADGVATQPFDEDQIRGLVSGATAAEASARLQEALHLEQPPQVRVEPDWATRAYRVDVIVAGDEKGP